MALLNPSDGEYPHISLPRVPNIEADRRKRGWGGGSPPSRNTQQHAQELSLKATQALEENTEMRRRYGIDPDGLLVLQFNNINIDPREVIERFGAWIVEEDSEKSGDETFYQVTVQFPNKSTVDSFLVENTRYQEGQGASENLPEKKTVSADALALCGSVQP